MNKILSKPSIPGITVRSVAASILCMLVMGIAIQYSVIHLVLDVNTEPGLPTWAMTIFIALTLMASLFIAVFKMRILTRAELVCILFTLLISTCMMTQGTWHRITTFGMGMPRYSNWPIMDAYNDKLWPHGANILDKALDRSHRHALATQGSVVWQETEYEEGQKATLPVLQNDNDTTSTSIIISLPVNKGNKEIIERGVPYLISFLVRGENMGENAYYFCRVYNDHDSMYSPVLTGGLTDATRKKITYLHKKGFVRNGLYGYTVSRNLHDTLKFELGLQGKGTIVFADPKFFNVNAIEMLYNGAPSVTQSQYNDLTPEERGGTTIRPDNMLSLRGALYYISGGIPLGVWATPLLAWFGFITLLLMACLAVNVIMRRQWAENERFQFPTIQIPLMLLDDDTNTVAPIWKNTLMWFGFGITMIWCLLRGWAFYNTAVPNLSINVPILDFFNNPLFGTPENMFNIKFFISAIVLSLCMFMELNVLISIVAGFFIARSFYWVGEFTGLKTIPDFPFNAHQQIGSFLGYGLIIIFFARKYLWNVLKAAIKGDKSASQNEVMSYRTAFGLLFACIAGVLIWANWLQVSMVGILLFFGFLVLIGVVSAKLRAECGFPFGYMAPFNPMLFVILLGGIPVFGSTGVMTALTFSGFITASVFFFIPGTQLELLETGRRFSIKRSHIVIAIVMGILGGILIGAWAFLGNSYAMGGDFLANRWVYGDKPWFFFSFEQQVATLTATMQSTVTDGATAVKGFDPTVIGYSWGFIGVVAISILRRLFAAFWFHPIGFIMGPSLMVQGAWGGLYGIWGPCLVAWVLRISVLKFGGARTVQTKLLPFFVGVFIAGICAFLVFFAIGSHLHSIGIDNFFRELL